jgi:hypothetical protein
MRSSEKNRYQDCLTVSNIALASVLTDSFGKTGTEIMELILSGESYDDATISSHVYGRARSKMDDILKSLHGFAFTDSQKEKIGLIKDHLRHLDTEISFIEQRMIQMAQPHWHLVELMCTIPGISKMAAVEILAEIGADMSVFESSKHLASWAGLAPCNDQSAGKKKSTKISRAGVYLKPLLVQCARAASRSKREPYFANKYWRLRRRKDDGRAIIAIARMMLTCIYQMLSTGEVFNPVDIDDVKPTVNTSSLTVDAALAFLAAQGYDISSIVQTRPEESSA